MKILISNDDGWQAKGINCLIEMLRPIADIVVCAPEGPRSGQSVAFSVMDYLTLRKIKEESGLQVYACSGTPVDCIKLALDQLFEEKPDMVIAGINHGDNGSVNTRYSGTMGACLEGCMKYIPSVAFSLCDHDPDADFSPLTPYVQKITRAVLENGLPEGVCLNVNFPVLKKLPPAANGKQEFRGMKVARMAKSSWSNEIAVCDHPRGFKYYWLTGSYTNDEPEAQDTDNWAVENGYVSITPTQIDVTAYQAFSFVENILQ